VYSGGIMLKLLSKMQNYSGYKDFDHERVEKAFQFATSIYLEHGGDIDEPMRVLDKIMDLKPDEDTVIAILFYDIYLTALVSDEVIREKAGDSVFSLLFALRKLLTLDYSENNKSSQVEVLRKMFLTMAKDIRVILIWLASRLCLMEDLARSNDEEYRVKMAVETMHFYVPIASRLGIYRLKTQLEDLSFKYLDPENHRYVDGQVKKFGKIRKVAIDLMRQNLIAFLSERGIRAEVVGRLKNVYSIFRKMKRKNLDKIDQLYDLFAIRVILPTVDGVDATDYLYTVLGLIHSEWRPISSRFKDYVAVPKPNGYRSLHTVILGLGPKNFDQPVEIQIRNSEMNREAEFGVASHWIYKGDKETKSRNIDSQIDWIKGLDQLDDLFSSDDELLKEVSLDLFRDRIFVLTPRGEVKDLPAGSIPLDFAYAVHTDVGHHCVMAKVNSVVVPLDYELKNGDVVEIVTRKESTPRLRWLSLVKSSFARNRIKAWFSGLNRENNLREGKNLVNAQLERLGKPQLNQTYSILKNYLGADLTVAQRESLLEEIGKGMQLASNVVRKIYPYEKSLPSADMVVRPNGASVGLEDQIVIGGEEGMPIKIASCCKPKHGDFIVAYITRGSRVSVHKSNCRLLDSLDGQRIIMAGWKGEVNKPFSHRIGIDMKVVSRVGLIRDVTSIVTSFGINIVDIMIKPAGGGLYNDCFLLDFNDLETFDILMDRLSEIEGVLKVSRMEEFK